MNAPRTIRIFASSPADLSTERQALASAVQELNTTIHALLPEKGIALELVAWETDTHPDIGTGPQAVIDGQLSDECDIFVGMMWKRFGTPTPKWGSGTEQEFRSAYSGWKTSGRPAHVLFYFSETPVSPKLTDAELQQLRLVGAFRAELETLGLVGNYPAPEAFGDLVRRHLVLVLSKLLHPGESPTAFAETVERSICRRSRLRRGERGRRCERIRANPRRDAQQQRTDTAAGSGGHPDADAGASELCSRAGTREQ